MLKYSCLIVEDEPLSAEILTDYIRQVPFLELRSVCADAIYAMELLQKEKFDLLFLDIHLPKLKGMEFLESLRNPPRVIIISAYKDYALQAFELNVVDYLLKPIRFSRFLKAVNKLDQQSDSRPVSSPAETRERTYFFFSVGKKKVKVFLDEILYIESLREYVRITTRDKNILTKFQLSAIEELLSRNNFIRIHRSFIVAKDKINAFTATDVEINNKQIPIGRSYKELVIGILERGV
ncbi:MAG TPA: LytTR family DNA-binding domain-containing protein [Puia sp.]|jgi:DNA-binding LytR/AlgR family response regulator|nr:LytTR family DNA-binding domain-containing protein [Puia sp.]